MNNSGDRGIPWSVGERIGYQKGCLRSGRPCASGVFSPFKATDSRTY
jgi:hypothetical protein